MGDVIGVMHEGRLHQWADAYSLYHRPATRFVAEFIGHGVFAPATISQVNNQVWVQTPVGELDRCGRFAVALQFEQRRMRCVAAR